jgi:RNA polymerase sigma factor (sigma-70 family)
MDVQKRVEMAAEIFEKHGATIRAFISHQVNGSSDADDIYQALFLSLVRRPVPLHVQNVVGYLYRAIQNDAIDAARRRKSYQDLISRYANEPQHNTVQEDVQSMAIEAEDTQRTVQTVKRHLRHHEAQAVFERYGCNYSDYDTTKTMSIKKRTLSRYVCTGLKKLRQLVQEGGDEIDDFLPSHPSVTSTNGVSSLQEGKRFSRQLTYV